MSQRSGHLAETAAPCQHQLIDIPGAKTLPKGANPRHILELPACPEESFLTESGTDPAGLEVAVQEWLAQPGPALLNVKVAPMELVMPPFTAVGPAYGMAMYSVKAVLHGHVISLWSQAKRAM